MKLVALTPLGLETQTSLLAEFRVPPPGLAALSSAELETLHRLFSKLNPSTTDR